MSHRVNKSYTGVTELLDSKKTLKDQTREYILNWIKERNLRPGDRLPPQRELSQILNVSPKIPELVLNELEAEHLVVRRCGRGTFLAGSPETAPRVSAGTRNVFLLLPTLRNPHFAEYAANAEVALHRGKRTMHIITGEAMPQTRDVIAQMVREGTGGIIALHCPDGLRAFAHRNRIPMVEIRYQSSASRRPAAGCFVIADLRAAAQKLGDHLLALGHRDIYLAGDLPATGRFRDCRFEFLTKMLEKHGCRVRYLPQKHLVTHYPSYEAIGAELAQAMLAEGLPATAAIFFNSQRAVGAMRLFLREGIRVPEDFSIVGFDAPFQAGFPEPVITSAVHNNVIEMAVSLLLSEKKDAQTVTIDPVLAEGSSTAPPRRHEVRP